MLMEGLLLLVIDVLGLSEPEALMEALELNDIEELELFVADARIDWLLEELSVLEAWIDGLAV
jgi:hypothetical protein